MFLTRAEADSQDSVRKKRRRIKDISKDVLGGVIEGRVVSVRESRRNVENPDNECLSFELRDRSGEIRVVAFGDICRKFSGEVKRNGCYRITAFKGESSHEKYNKTGHPCEIHLLEVVVTIFSKSCQVINEVGSRGIPSIPRILRQKRSVPQDRLPALAESF